MMNKWKMKSHYVLIYGYVMSNRDWQRIKKSSGWPLPFVAQAPELFQVLLILSHLLFSPQTPRQLSFQFTKHITWDEQQLDTLIP